MAVESSLVQDAAWRLASTIALTLVSLVSVPVFARLLGMEQWGLLTLFQAAIAPMALLDLGVATATVKYVAEAIGRGDREEATNTVQTTLIFNLVIGSCGCLGLLLAARLLASQVFAIPPDQQDVATTGFRLIGLNWFAGVVGATCSGVLVAHRLFGRASRLRTLAGLANGGGGVLTVLLGGGLLHVVVVQTLVNLMMTALWFGTASRSLPGLRVLPRWHGALFRRSLSFGSWQAIASAGGLLAGWSDRYILGARFSPATVGVYAVAYSLVSAAYGAFHDMGEVLFPAVSQKQGAGALGEARLLSLQAGWALSTVFGIVLAVIAAVGGDFIGLWVSRPAAQMGTPVLRLLCVGCVLGMAITGPFFLCLGLGKSRLLAVSSLTTGLVVLGLGVLLTSRVGLTGVGWAMIGGALAQWLVLVQIARLVYLPETRLLEFALYIWAPPCAAVAVLALLVRIHDAVDVPPSWSRLAVECAMSLLLATGLQLACNEVLPGGGQRRKLLASLLALLGIRLRSTGAGGLPIK
jgi:O-antigen/teichoic acid export membrane protein